MARKVYVRVNVVVNTEGEIRPLTIIWEDGRQFEITQITDVRRAASMNVGGVGTRYTCLIDDKEKYLYREDVTSETPRWFVEGK